MKKIYALMLSAAFAAGMTASAKDLVPMATKTINTSSLRIEMKVNEANLHEAEGINLKTSILRSSRADEWESIGTAQFFDGLFSGTEVEVEVEQNKANPGEYRLLNAWSHLIGGGETLPLVIDATNPDCVNVPVQSTGLTNGADGLMEVVSASVYLMVQGLTEEEVVEYYPEMCITMAEGFIDIPLGTLRVMFPESPQYTDSYVFNDSEDSYIILPGSTVTPQWGEAKEGKMFDGFFEPMFNSFEPKEVPVLIQKNNWKEGVYRVIDPWEGLLGEPYGGYLIIDASYPDCVVIPLQSSDISTGPVEEGGRGLTYICSYSDNFESIEDFLESGETEFNITMDPETGVITFPAVTKQFSDGSEGEVSPMFCYWPDYNSQSLFYVPAVLDTPTTCGYIVLPDFTAGVSDVAVDAENNAAPVYYNIQGMQIANPAAGQIVIVKKGNQVTKTIIR